MICIVWSLDVARNKSHGCLKTTKKKLKTPKREPYHAEEKHHMSECGANSMQFL